jgi:hypothetical protein
LFYWHFDRRIGRAHSLRCIAAILRSTAFGCNQRQILGFTGGSRAFNGKVGVATGK